jgi:hypothetical protein
MRRSRKQVRAVVLRLESPGAGAYDLLASTLQTVQEELLATQTELAVANAKLKIAAAEIQLLSDINSRDRSRVAAEIAASEVSRAKAIANAGEFRRES